MTLRESDAVTIEIVALTPLAPTKLTDLAPQLDDGR